MNHPTDEHGSAMTEAERLIVERHNAAVLTFTDEQVAVVDRLIAAALLVVTMVLSDGSPISGHEALQEVISREAEGGKFRPSIFERKFDA